MRKFAVCGIIAFIVHSSLHSQERISFFEEHIDFNLDSLYFSVNGVYSFCNREDEAVDQFLFFPFAEETVAIDSIRVVDLNKWMRIPFRRLDKMIAFSVHFLPRDTVNIHIFYRQKTASRNTYIITSTQSWKRALEKAVYTLTSSIPVDETQFSYPFLFKEKRDDRYFYSWEMTDFLPEKEFEVVALRREQF
jgi:hypothetical protein